VGLDVAKGGIQSANENEATHYPELYERTVDALGGPPGAVAADRAYSNNAVYEHDTRRGVATVVPWRNTSSKKERRLMDAEGYDRHGVPRCPHCGGPGDLLAPGQGLYFARGGPRLRFRCLLRLTPECARQHSIACAESGRMLVPLPRVTERYYALKKASKNAEHVYRHWRDRYAVFGNNVDTRPKRPGIAWQNLRASVVLLIEWFRLSARYGWLGSPRRRRARETTTQRTAARTGKALL
jgi:hypothetical protein